MFITISHDTNCTATLQLWFQYFCLDMDEITAMLAHTSCGRLGKSSVVTKNSWQGRLQHPSISHTPASSTFSTVLGDNASTFLRHVFAWVLVLCVNCIALHCVVLRCVAWVCGVERCGCGCDAQTGTVDDSRDIPILSGRIVVADCASSVLR